MSMEIGVDDGKCVTCKRGWPQTTFKNYDESDATLPMECDQCIAAKSRVDQIAEKIDEARNGGAAVVVRQVVVTGIKSGTKVTGFRYPTHANAELAITDLLVTFENGSEYLYENVPVVVCEAWMGDTSFGTYFIQQIKNSYDFKKVK
jgi:hypothetical protein